jgi:hypothetical protein
MFFFTKMTLLGDTNKCSERKVFDFDGSILSKASIIYCKSIERLSLTPNFFILPSLKNSFKDPKHVE